MLHEVAAALIIHSERILLGQRSASREYYPGVWDVFGGHVEAGEERHQTLIRELQEELGITPTQWTYLETMDVPASLSPEADSDHLILHLYLVTAWEGTPENMQLAEHSTIGWFSLEAAVQLPLAHHSYPGLFARHLKSDFQR